MAWSITSVSCTSDIFETNEKGGPGSEYGFPGKTQLPKSKKSDDVISL